jgi:hypothetical protein
MTRLIGHKQYIDKNGPDVPEIRDWKWGLTHEQVQATLEGEYTISARLSICKMV